MAPDGPPRDSTHWLCLPRFSVKRMGTIIFLNKQKIKKDKEKRKRIEKIKMIKKLYLCESQNWPVGPGGEISLLGVAAPLSSRKTGYLLRVAHMIPIIFFRRNGSRRPSAGLHSLALLASLFC